MIEQDFKIDGPNGSFIGPCGDNIHQRAVRVCWRDKEDSETGLYASTAHWRADQKEPQALTRGLRSGDAFGRRDSLEIDFECEQCNGIHTLMIYQHKGQTLSFWKSEA